MVAEHYEHMWLREFGSLDFDDEWDKADEGDGPGLSSTYYSWRMTQYGLLVFAALSLVMTIFFQPETSQPGARGVDEIIERDGKVSWVWLNPFSCLAMLRSPNVLLTVGRHFFS